VVVLGRLGGVLAAVLALSACAGDDDRSLLSSSEFAQQASAICEQFAHATSDAQDPQTGELVPNAAYLDEVIPSLETLVRRLKGLRPEGSIAQETEALVGRFEDLLDAEIEMRDAARRGDHRGFTDALGKVIPLAYETSNRASKLGWKGCA
jgi:hypothetical protein